MPAPAGIDASNPAKLTEGILTLLRGGEHKDAARWAEVCSGSGHCIPKCQHGVDPRFMLTMARLEMASRNPDNARRKTGFAAFGNMTTGVRVLSRMQLPRTTVAVQMLRDAKRPYIVVLTNPTTGGVTASYAIWATCISPSPAR